MKRWSGRGDREPPVSGLKNSTYSSFYKSMVYHEHDPDGWNRRPHRQGFPPPAASDGEDNDIEDDDDEENDSDLDSDESEDYIEEPDPEHEARMAALRAENAR